MNNLKKTIAAGVVGVALLAGTAGTFATWQHAESVTAGAIKTGDMGVTLGWANTWTVQTNNGRVDAGTNLGSFPLVPGQHAWRNLDITPELTGLTINDITLSTEFGSLNLDEQGYLLNNEGERSALRFQVITTTNNADWMFRHPELRVTFERSAEYGMYENDLDFNLGDIVVTITQK